MRFTLDQLTAFIAVAEEQHFSRAAKRLNITQPPLSRQIKTLERNLGVELLDRSGRGTQLSVAGKVFLTEARKVLALAASAENAARRAATGTAGVVDLGFTTVVGNASLPGLLTRAAERLPDVGIVLHEMSTLKQVNALAAGQIDLGLARPSHLSEQFRSRSLPPDPLLLAVPRGSALLDSAISVPRGGNPVISLESLTGTDFVMYASDGPGYVHDLVSSILALHRVRPRYVQHVIEAYTMLRLVDAGLGAAIVPASTRSWSAGNTVFADVPELEQYQAESMLIWQADSFNPALHRLLEALQH